MSCPAVNPYQIVPASNVKKVKTSLFADPLVNVGAVAAAQSTLAGHVAVLSEESCVQINVNEHDFPVGDGLLKVNVVF